MNKIPYFFLILLITVLVFISAKPEGFDNSNNYVKGSTGPVGSKGATGSPGPPGSIQNIIVFTPGNIAIFTIGIVLFIIMIILIIKLNSINTSSS